MKTKVVLRGAFLSSSGYGVHARQIARWILSHEQDWNLDVTFQVLPWGITPWLLDSNMEDGLIGKITERTTSNEKNFDVSIQVQLPNEWDPNLAKYNIGITAAVETDKSNPKWVEACNKMSSVVFPSKHAEQSISNVGVISTPHYVIPEAFSDAFVKDDKDLPNLNLEFDSKFNFLIVGQLSGFSPETDRKNILNCLKWTFEAFQGNEEVGIVLKTNAGRHSKIDRHNCVSLVSQIVKETRKNMFPKIHIVHGMMSDEEMASLYRHHSIKALLAPTRGEGFGLPILEAAVNGLPIISTGWSGHTEFLSAGKSISIDYELTPVHPSKIDGNIFVQNSRWANPSESDFKKKIKKFKENNSIPKDWAKDLQQKLISSHSQKEIEKKYDEHFEKILKR